MSLYEKPHKINISKKTPKGSKGCFQDDGVRTLATILQNQTYSWRGWGGTVKYNHLNWLEIDHRHTIKWEVFHQENLLSLGMNIRSLWHSFLGLLPLLILPHKSGQCSSSAKVEQAMKTSSEADRAELSWFRVENRKPIPGGNGTPLQYSCLANPMDRGTWWAAVHGVTKSRTRLSDFTFTFHFHALEKEIATHSSILAWRIPGTGEPGGLPSMWLQSQTRLKRLSSSSIPGVKGKFRKLSKQVWGWNLY